MNLDILPRTTAIDPKYADNAVSKTANSQSAFGDYLQRAQTQPADQLVSRSIDREARKASEDSSPRRQDTTSSASTQHDSSPTSTNEDAPTTSQDHRNDGRQDSGSGSSNQDASRSSDAAKKDDAHKVATGDVAGVIVDLNMAATAAASVTPIAGGNPANDAQTQAALSLAGTKPGNALSPPVAINVPQAIPATANTNSPAVTAQPAAAQTAVAELTAVQTTAASPTDPTPKEKPVAMTATVTADSSTTATVAKADDKTAGQASTADINSIAASAAVVPVNPAANVAATTPADPKPPSIVPLQSAAASGVRVASANQAADTAPAQAASANGEAPTATDVQSARDQRAKSAADAISQSGSGDDTNKTTTQPGDSTSGQTAAVPQTAAHSATGTGGSPGTAHAAETTLSQADRVRFVQRVEQVFQDLNGQDGSVRLRLSPPELGSLHIEIKVAKGEMTARVEAETPAARNILLDNLPALRERLAQHDIKVQRFDVDLMDRSTGGMSNQSSQYQNPSQQNLSSTIERAPFRGNRELPSTVEAALSRPASDGGRLNVVV